MAVILVTPERLAAYGAAYDPAEAATHRDFVVELSLDRAPFCPPMPPFDLWTRVGIEPWAPYVHGCGGPSDLTDLVAEGDHVDLVGRFAVGLDDADLVRVRITPRADGRYSAAWRAETPADAPWSAPITLVDGKESTIGRLPRYRREAGLEALTAVGADVAKGVARVGDVEVSFTPKSCQLGQWECAPDKLAVGCSAGKGGLLLLDGKLSAPSRVSAWTACVAGPLPGVLAGQ